MAQASLLSKGSVVAFVPVSDRAKARAFYEGVLGLKVMAEEPPFATVLDANGTMVRLTAVGEFTAARHTVLGWHVESINSAVAELMKAGVEFLRFPGLNDKDTLGIWTAPGGARIAWFKDPDGNVLSVTEF